MAWICIVTENANPKLCGKIERHDPTERWLVSTHLTVDDNAYLKLCGKIERQGPAVRWSTHFNGGR